MKPKKQYLKLSIDGRKLEATRESYVTAKTKALREFGYSNLTEQEVNDQITAIIDGKPTNVVGKFMEDEVLGVA